MIAFGWWLIDTKKRFILAFIELDWVQLRLQTTKLCNGLASHFVFELQHDSGIFPTVQGVFRGKIWKIELFSDRHFPLYFCKEVSRTYFLNERVRVWMKQIAIKVFLHDFVVKLEHELLCQVQHTAPTMVGLSQSISDCWRHTVTRSSLIIFDDCYSGLSVHFSVFSSVRLHLTFIRFRCPWQVFPKDELTIDLKKSSSNLFFAWFRFSVSSFTYGASHFCCLNESTLWSLVITNPSST